MALYPGATLKLIPRYRKPLKASQVILHTAVSNARSLHGFFSNENRADDTCSHFYVDDLGRVEQYIDTRYQAPANRNANASAISIETWDGLKPAQTPWNAAQLVTLLRLILWAHEAHGVPLRLCSSPTGAGVGYHAMWGAPSAWTPARGKTCPGPARIPQVANLIKLAATPDDERLFKTLNREEELEVLEAARAINRSINTRQTSKVDNKTALWWSEIDLFTNAIATRTEALVSKIADKVGVQK